MEQALRVDSLSKRYGQVTVLDRVSFELPRGSVTLLTGRSGSGKSTLFKLLAGLDHPTSGQIHIDGTDIAEMDDEQLAELRLRRLGIVFQSFNLLPDLTAAENVRLPMALAGVPRKTSEARAHELLTLVGVDHRAAARPHAMSGGEQQRVAIARALTNRPALLLADEPTGNLDRKNAEHVLDMLREVNDTLGTTMLVITHDELASRWFSRRIALTDGHITDHSA